MMGHRADGDDAATGAGVPHRMSRCAPWLAAALFCAAMSLAVAQTTPSLSLSASKAELWYVFPDSVDVYTTPSLEARKTPFKLHSGQKIAALAVIPRDESRPAFLEFARNGATYYAPEGFLTRIVQYKSSPLSHLQRFFQPNLAVSGISLPIGAEQVDRNTPLPIDYKPGDLVFLPREYCGTELPQRLRKEAAQQCIAILDAARKDGVSIKILSAYRSYAQQVHAYLHAVGSAGLQQRASAKPGHSEHQLGTTVDLGGDDPKFWFRQEFAATPAGAWLRENTGRFGFVQSFREDNENQTGYMPEPWHFRYVGTTNVRRFLEKR
jgi:LAS superfamily LD-carboxypeptidase LdcB